MAPPDSKSDSFYLARAITLAKKAEGRTAPNPPVGAVVVNRGGEIIGRGWHKAAGQAHAEPMALDEAGKRARGARLYVTLEPCNHTGRTPPCSQRIIRAGLSEVIIGSLDPNPKVAGGGAAVLEAAGIKVRHGLLKDRCDELLAPFARHVATGRPWVTLKLAASLDGRVTTKPGLSQWLTGAQAGIWTHRLRNVSEAILVGAQTVVQDDPALTCRLEKGPAQNPLRVVLDSTARTLPSAKVITGPKVGSPAGGGCLIITGPQADSGRVAALRTAGAQVEPVAGDENGRPRLEAVLDLLGGRGVMRLMVEGGPTVAGVFLRAGLVDEVYLIAAPLIIGGSQPAPVVSGPVIEEIGQATRLTWRPVRRLGRDLLLHAWVDK